MKIASLYIEWMDDMTLHSLRSDLPQARIATVPSQDRFYSDVS